MTLKQINLLDKRFGQLTVVKYDGHYEPTGNDLSKRHFWLCKCDCGNDVVYKQDYLFSGKFKSCGCLKKQTGFKNSKFRGFGEIPLKYFNGIKRRCDRTKRHKFSITIEYVWRVFLKQNRKCALSGEEIHFNGSDISAQKTASLDRIDNTKGYIKGNVQWVHKDVNALKQDFEQNYFIKWCNKIAKNHPCDIIIP